jgi:hypothetical protein
MNAKKFAKSVLLNLAQAGEFVRLKQFVGVLG